jgi:hypothetical protein
MVTQANSPANSAKRGDFRILWLPAFFCLLLIAFEVNLLVNDRYFSRPHTSAQGETIATYVSGRNRVRKKTAGTLVWEAPEEQVPLYREDAIATMEDSEAVITFADHSELVVEPSSLVILEQAPESKPGAPSAGIVARLVKGSVKRRNSGTAPFFIKLSRSRDAQPVEFSDTAGNSVFRVIYRIEGYDVVVESGAVKVQGRTVTPSPKLKAPKLNRPTIEMVPVPEGTKDDVKDGGKSGKGEGALDRWWSLLIADARAAEARAADARQIAIHFSWEGIEGAGSYRVQVSRDPSFATILREGEVIGTTFEFLFPAPDAKSELYFRVAGVTLAREVGEYSSIEKIEVNPLTPEAPVTVKAEQGERLPAPPPIAARAPKPSPRPAATPAATPAAVTAAATLAAATPAPPAPEASPIATRAPAPAPAARTARVAAYSPPAPSALTHFWLSYGALYDHRQFKSDTGRLREAAGGGIVPAQLSAEFRRSEDNHVFFSAGGSYVFESARPELPAPSNSAISVGALRAWATFGKSFGASTRLWIGQAGPYLATTKRISNQSLTFQSENRWLLGALLSVQTDPELALESGDIAWRLQAALLVVGGIGVDAQVAARKALFRTGGGDGIFAGVELGTRQTAAESAFAIGLHLGWWH